MCAGEHHAGYSMLLCLPVTLAQLRQLAAGDRLVGPLTAFGPTHDLAETFDVEMGSEEAEFAAAQVAAVASLAANGERRTVSAEVPATAIDAAALSPETANGGLVVRELRPEWVQGWFADQHPADARDAAAAAAGLSVDLAWAQPQVQTLLAERDLLWHSLVEIVRFSND